MEIRVTIKEIDFPSFKSQQAVQDERVLQMLESRLRG